MPVPAALVTLTLPEVPLATTALIAVGDKTVNDAAAVPPKSTAVVPKRSVPVIITIEFVMAVVGVNEVITGTGGIMKVKPESATIPPAVVILRLPVDPPATVAIMVVGDNTVKRAAAEPPKFTLLTLAKLVPVMVMIVPGTPDTGVNEVIVGGGI